MFEKYYNQYMDRKMIKKVDKLLDEGFRYSGEIVEINGNPYYEIEASFVDRYYYTYSHIYINEEKVYRASCNCPIIGRNNGMCEHIIAAIIAAEDYAEQHPLRYTSTALTNFMNQRKGVDVNKPALGYQVSLVPCLALNKDGVLNVSFKIGHKQYYVVKNLTDFVNRMRRHETFQYGKNLVFSHQEKYFDEISLKNYYLIKEYVDLLQSHIDPYYVSGNVRTLYIKRELDLEGKRLDEFFDLNVDNPLMTGLTLKREDVPISISVNNSNNRFKLEGEGNTFIQGVDHLYCVEGDTLYQMSRDYMPVYDVMYLLNRNDNSLSIDSQDMNQFYSQVMPELEKYCVVNTNFDPEPYRPLEAKFVFYLDEVDGVVTLEYTLNYGQQSCRLEQYTENLDRNLSLETSVSQFLVHYFNTEDHFTYTIKSDDALFELLSHGIDELNTFGEVYASNKYKRLQILSTPKMNLGIRLESSLLNIHIDIEDLDYEELSAALKSYRLKKKYHRLKSGEFLVVDEEAFSLLDELVGKSSRELKELAEGNLSIPAYRGLYIDSLLEEGQRIDFDKDQQYNNLIHDFGHLEDNTDPVPDGLHGELRNYQIEGYRWLKTLYHYGFGGILADDMGLGKTLQMITLLLSIRDELDSPALVVCPASLVYNWQSEIERFAPDLRALAITGNLKHRKELLKQVNDYDIVVTSYDLLKRDVTYYEDLQFSVQVIDEAQFIKNANTLQTKAVKAIKATHRFALSGTPIENRLSELWSIFDFLMPGFLYPYSTFRDTFENPIVKKNDENAMAKLQKMIRPFILRRLKKDVLKDLPDKIEKVMYAKMEEKQNTIYTNYAKNVKYQLSAQSDEEFTQSKIKVLAELTRLRQLCCDPNLCIENYDGGSAKLDQCIDLIETGIEGNHKLLVFSQFTSMLDLIAKRLQQKNIQYYVLKGETSKEQRAKDVNAFNQNDVPVYLISLRAGGTGLNLTAADIVIHYDPWWNEAAMTQATDRAHRIGQRNVVSVYKMIVKDTIEEEILKLQEAKNQLANSILDGQNTSIASLTKEDLMDILK